jgi:hypothetical protein
MKIKFLFVLLTLSLSAHAQLQPGETELTLANGARYQGTVKNGKPDGMGYMRLKSGVQYEGGFKDGEPHGYGIMVTMLGDRYEGQVDNGIFSGKGKMVFRLGGSYDGQWAKGRFNGKGIMTYAGSGRVLEGEFANGLPVGAKAPVKSSATYSLRDEAHRLGSHILSNAAMGAPYPLNLRYEEMSADEKGAMHRMYPGLAPDDEPPFPAAGLKDILLALKQAQQKVLDNGVLTLIVDVGADGKPSKVMMYGENNPDLKKFAGTLFMQQTYKPGVCDGKPCALPFYFSMGFKTTL